MYQHSDQLLTRHPRLVVARAVALLLLLAPLSLLPAQTPATRPAAAAPAPRPKLQLELGFQMSMTSSYAIGNVDQWFEEITVPGEGLTDTAPGFNQVDVRFLVAIDGSPLRFGFGVGGYLGSPRAFNGQSAAAQTQFHATPNIFFITVPFQLRLGPVSSTTYLMLEPAMGIGFVKEGSLSISTSTYHVLAPMPTLGYQLGAGIEHYLGRLAILGRVGYRAQTIGTGYTDSAGDVQQYLVPSTNERVVMDLSGAYATLGVVVVVAR